MKKLTSFVFTFFVLFIMSGAASSGIYSWVDANGIKHFSDHPPGDSTSEQQVKVIPTPRLMFPYEENFESQFSSPEKRLDNDTPADEAGAAKEYEVELYVTSWCGYCKKARAFFQSRGIPFKEYDIEKDRSAAERKKRLDTRRGVPFAMINGQGIHGYIPAAYDRALAGK